MPNNYFRIYKRVLTTEKGRIIQICVVDPPCIISWQSQCGNQYLLRTVGRRFISNGKKQIGFYERSIVPFCKDSSFNISGIVLKQDQMSNRVDPGPPHKPTNGGSQGEHNPQ